MGNALPVDQRLETAGNLVVRTRIFYDIWWFFKGAKTRPAIVDTMQCFSEFFRLDEHAHFVAFVVHIAALFDKRRDTIKLPRLVKEPQGSNFRAGPRRCRCASRSGHAIGVKSNHSAK
jgi:hypothetical protein